MQKTEEYAKNFSSTLENSRNTVREYYRIWKKVCGIPKVEPAASLCLSLIINGLDILESVEIILSSINEDESEEQEFIQKSASRILILRLYEQRQSLYRASKKIELIAAEDNLPINIEEFKSICKKK